MLPARQGLHGPKTRDCPNVHITARKERCCAQRRDDRSLLWPACCSDRSRRPRPTGALSFRESPATSVIAGNKYSFKPTASDPNGDCVDIQHHQPSRMGVLQRFDPADCTERPERIRSVCIPTFAFRVRDGLLRVALPAFSIEVRPATTPPPSGNTLAKLLNFAETGIATGLSAATPWIRDSPRTMAAGTTTTPRMSPGCSIA
jgi:hypothetical protein